MTDPQDRIDPAGLGSPGDLAEALTRLRTGLGLTVRDVARTTGIPVATVGGYFSGRHLPPPTQPAPFTALLTVLGVAEADVPAWHEALVRLRRVPGPRREAAAPYRGLESYRVEDAALYVGREHEVEQLWAMFAALVDEEGPTAVAVIGPSGSGKSSLLQAGLLGSEQAAGVEARTLMPADLLDLPADLLAPPAEGAPPRLVVIDQLEQVLTERFTAAERERIVGETDRLAACPRTVVALGLRADFVDRALSEPGLSPLVRRRQLLVGALDLDVLRRVVAEPAQRVGRAIGPEVVDLVAQDLAPRGVLDDPATLPLLSHALLVAWENAGREGLTTSTYVASGGVRGAVQRSAEEAYTALDASGREAARRLFGRLVLVDAEGVAVRRPVVAEDLSDDDALLRAAESFVAQRILTATETGYEISHEVVLVAWPRLRGWVSDDREYLSLRHRVGQAMALWEEHGRGPDTLLRGPLLHVVRDLPETRLRELSGAERAFVGESIAAAGAAAARRRRQRSGLVVLAISALVLALVATVLSVHLNGARADADAARSVAETARAEALSRQVATKATLVRASEPALAARLALAAYRINPTREARSAVLESTGERLPSRLLGPEGPSRAVASPDGSQLAVAGADGAVRLYARTAGHAPEQVSRVQVDEGQLFAASYDATGERLAAAGSGGTVALLDVRDPAHPSLLVSVATPKVDGAPTGVQAVLLDHGVLYAASGVGLLRWRVDGTRLVPLPRVPAMGVVHDVTTSRSGLIAVAGTDGAVSLWRPAAGDRLAEVRRFTAVSDSQLTSVAFSPDGRTVVSGSKDAAVRVFDVDGSADPVRTLGGFTSWVNDLEFSPDGSRLLAGGSGAKIQTWRTRDWQVELDIPIPANVGAVGYADAGSTIVTAAIDGTVRLLPTAGPQPQRLGDTVWNLMRPASGTTVYVGVGAADPSLRAVDLADPTRPVVEPEAFTAPASAGSLDGSASASPDGRFLVGGTEAGKVAVWRTDGQRDAPVVVPAASQLIEATSVSPDSTRVAVASDDGTVTLFDPAPAVPRRVGRVKIDSLAMGVSFSPDGTLLAVGGADNRLHLFTLADRKEVASLEFDNYVYGSAFSPDGRYVAAGGADRTVRVWDIEDPTDPQPVGEPVKGPSGTVFNVAWSADGARLAAASQDGRVWMWTVRDGDLTADAELANLGAGAVGVVWSPDGRTLVATGLDGVIGTWATGADGAGERICAVTGSPVTDEEWERLLPGVEHADPCAAPGKGS